MSPDIKELESDGGDMTEFKLHEASALFPILDNDGLKSLAEDIKSHGLLEPITIYEGKVLDGRNRLAACKLAKVTPAFEKLDKEIVLSPLLYVISKNLHRRHLTTGQRSTIATEMIPMLAKEAKKRQLASLRIGQESPSGPNGPDGKTKDLAPKGRARAIAAKALGVSETSVRRALQAKKIYPVLFEKVKRGETTVHAASEGRAPTRRHKGLRKDKTAPYEVKTEGQRVRAVAQMKKMVSGLSTISGHCRGLGELDILMAIALCEAKEVKMWAKIARELARQLVSLARKLEKGGIKK